MFFLAKSYGPIGSAIGTTISLFIVNILMMNIYYYKVIKIDIPKFWDNIIKMTVPNIIPILIILMLEHFIYLKGFLNVIVFGGIYTIIYAIICYFITMNDYEKEIVYKIMKKIPVLKKIVIK